MSLAEWPSYDEALTVDSEIEIAIQINGKVKDKMMIAADTDRAAMEKIARESDVIAALVGNRSIVKVIAVPGKLLNIVVK